MSDKFVGKYNTGVVEVEEDCSYFNANYVFGKFVCISRSESYLESTGNSEYAESCYTKLPVYMLVHSVVRVSVEPFNCPFDSWQWGYICVSEADIRAYFDLKEDDYIDNNAVHRALIASVAVVDSFLSGDVYTYTVTENNNGDTVASVGGITSYEKAVELMKTAVSTADKEYEEREYPLLVATGTLED